MGEQRPQGSPAAECEAPLHIPEQLSTPLRNPEAATWPSWSRGAPPAPQPAARRLGRLGSAPTDNETAAPTDNETGALREPSHEEREL